MDFALIFMHLITCKSTATIDLKFKTHVSDWNCSNNRYIVKLEKLQLCRVLAWTLVILKLQFCEECEHAAYACYMALQDVLKTEPLKNLRDEWLKINLKNKRFLWNPRYF